MTPILEHHTSDTSPDTPSQSRVLKPQRVLACVLCQQRKVKCDRKLPCANCTKSQVQCVPASLAQRRRRRRFPEREILDRLLTYEHLLHRNNVIFEPFHKNLVGEKESLNAEVVDDLEDGHPETERLDSCPNIETKGHYEAKYTQFEEGFFIWLILSGIFGTPWAKEYDCIALNSNSAENV